MPVYRMSATSSVAHGVPCRGRFADVLAYMNYILLFVFLTECAVRLIALGLLEYFSHFFNVIDFLTVVASVIEVRRTG